MLKVWKRSPVNIAKASLTTMSSFRHHHGGNGLRAAPGAEEAEAGGDAPGGRTVRAFDVSICSRLSLKANKKKKHVR